LQVDAQLPPSSLSHASPQPFVNRQWSCGSVHAPTVPAPTQPDQSSASKEPSRMISYKLSLFSSYEALYEALYQQSEEHD
jgi:hypothetical protein